MIYIADLRDREVAEKGDGCHPSELLRRKASLDRERRSFIRTAAIALFAVPSTSVQEGWDAEASVRLARELWAQVEKAGC